MDLENSKNLGDNLLQLNFMRRACLANKQLSIDYYCASLFHAQLSQFIDAAWSGQIRLHSYDKTPPGAIDTWIAGRLLPGFYWSHPKRGAYNEFYFDWFQRLSKAMGIKSPITAPIDVAFSHPLFEDFGPVSRPEFMPEYDVLVIDCEPKSGQFVFDRSIWDMAKARWRQSHSIISVVDIKLTLVQIGLLAARAKNVVSVCTGPLHVAFNTVSLPRVAQWHIFHDAHTYTYVPQIHAHRFNMDLLDLHF